MIYFKHSDLSDKYHVSLKTVHNWIDSAKQGKVKLKLHSVTNRTYVANTPENLLVLNDLADKGKKYRNTLHHKIINPKPEFYEVLSRRQVLGVINGLSVHREIPREYCYLNSGATSWDQWVKRISQENAPGHLRGTRELLKTNVETIDRLLEGAKKINVVDLGLGNAYPVKDFVGHLLESKSLHRYIGIDISPSMLEIAENNLKTWYGSDFPFEGHVRDITHERFDDLLVDDMLHDNGDGVINLVLLLGGTPNNFQSYDSAFRVAYDSMNKNDILITADKPDTEASRMYFDFSSNPGADKLSDHQNGYILSLLNIDETLCDLEMGFDKEQMIRYLRVRLKTSITIRFEFEDITRSVSIDKGETILLLRIRHLSALQIVSTLKKIGFTLLQSSLTKDRQYFLSISGVEVKKTAEL